MAAEPDADRRHLLVVYQSRSGSTASLCEAVVAGATEAADDTVQRRVLTTWDAGPDDVRWAEAVILGTPANFGYMSGALKDFFERIYHPCLDASVGLPYGLFVKGDTDAEGAVASVERIVAGLRWRAVRPPLVVVGPLSEEHLAAASELGAVVAAGLDAGLY
jgi:multimeric flavodoxin WrbA